MCAHTHSTRCSNIQPHFVAQPQTQTETNKRAPAIRSKERKTQLEEKNVRATSQCVDFSSGPPALAVLGMGINGASS